MDRDPQSQPLAEEVEAEAEHLSEDIQDVTCFLVAEAPY